MEDSPKPAKKLSPWVRIPLYATLLVVVAAIAIPNYVKSRGTACKNACINNLRQIDGAKEQWALENKLPAGTQVDEAEVDKYIKGGHLTCPGGGVYSYNAVASAPTCSLGHTL